MEGGYLLLPFYTTLLLNHYVHIHINLNLIIYVILELIIHSLIFKEYLISCHLSSNQQEASF